MAEISSSNKRIAKNTVFLSIRMVIVLFVNLLTTRIVLHALGVEDYGVYNVVCGFVTMFGFLNTSMSNGIQRFFNYEYGKNGEEGANRVFCTSVYIQAALAIIVVFLVEVIGLWYLHNKMVIPTERMVASEWIFQFSVLMFVLGIMQAPFSAAVMAHERMDFYAFVSVLDAVLKCGIAFLLMSVSSDRLIVYGALMASISVLNIVVYFIYCKKCFREIRFVQTFDKQMFMSMLGFSGWNLFGSFSGVMVDQGINLVLNFFFGPVINTARGIALQIKGAVQSFVVNISMPVRPQVSQSYAQGNLGRTMSLTYGVSKISSAIVIMLSIPISLEIDFLLKVWLGEFPSHTSAFTILILLTALVTNLNWATSGVVHATGIMRDYQVWGSLVKILAVPLSYFLISKYHIPEVALVTVLICEAIAHFIGLFIVRRLVGMSVRDYLTSVALPIILVMFISLSIIGPVRFLLNEGIARLVIISCLSVLVVGSLFFYLCLNRSERSFAIQMVKSVISKFRI